MGLGPTEIILVILVIVLLFGAKKLPELARGSGRALRIFKAETKGLLDDDDDEKTKTEEQKQIDAQRAETIRYEQPSTSTTDPSSTTPPRLRRGLTPPLPKLTGLVRMFSVRPASPVGADGKMALADHLREVRGRLLRVVVVLSVLMVVMLFLYDHLLNIVLAPYNDAKEQLGDSVETKAYIKGAAGPLLLQLKLSGIAALVVASPYWLYQIWAFILPGLHPSERKWSRLFAAVAGPLFITGVAVGYYVLPRGLEVLIGFTPAELENLVEFGEYFSFFTRMLLVFGVSFEIPLFVIMLNLAGVVSGKALGEHRAWIIIGVFVFAAAATPSTDPFSMLMLALPMTLLFAVSEVIARLVDRRRRRASSLAGVDPDLDDDEVSSLDYQPDDVRRSDLDEDD